MFDFDEIIPREGSCCVKYDALNEYFGRTDLLPMWVADMDFKTPAFIVDALKKRLNHPVLGYPVLPENYFENIAKWVEDLHGWKTEPEWMRYIPGIVKGIGLALNVFMQAGDKVIIQTPVYHPFRIVPLCNGFDVVYNPLIPVYDTGKGDPAEICGEDRYRNLESYDMDFEQLESIIDDKTKVLILANPHNPVGICWKPETLRKLAEITSRRGILVISDEIHGEMALDGNIHTPFATVSEEAAMNSITFMAPTKTFNIAGVVSSYSIIPNPEIRERFYNFLDANELSSPDIFAPVATMAAYSSNGKCWRSTMLEYVRANIEYVNYYLISYVPEIKVVKPQASFLIWLDCRRLNMTQEELVEFMKDKAHLAVNDGMMFGIEGEGFIRMNVGCSRKVIYQALAQIRKAVEDN